MHLPRASTGKNKHINKVEILDSQLTHYFTTYTTIELTLEKITSAHVGTSETSTQSLVTVPTLHAPVRQYVYIYICIYVYIRIHIHIHIEIYTHTHTHTHTH